MFDASIAELRWTPLKAVVQGKSPPKFKGPMCNRSSVELWREFGKWPPELKTISNKLISKKTAGKEHKTFKAKDGKESVTNFKVEFSFKEFTQLRAKPTTGRTHQIRFHCFDSGFPIIGDKKYFLGESKAYSKRLMLHAKEISFIDGSEKVVIKTKDDYGLSDFRKNL